MASERSGTADPGARRKVVQAFATLGVMMAAHATLESARDALLLGALSPTALLWSYVVIAAITVVTTRFTRGRTLASLPAQLVLGAVAAVAFAVVLPWLPPAGAMALYVFTALYASIVVPRFWLQLSDSFTVGEAKRYYAWVGVGGLAGAAVGSALAASLVLRASALSLLWLGALLYLLAALVARVGGEAVASAGPALTEAGARGRREPVGYVRRVVGVALLASATFTVVDYLFKSAAAASVPKAELAGYFARVYTGMNVLAVVFQIALAPLILKRWGTHLAAVLLPVLLLGSVSGFALLGLPLLALGAKTADGALRNSLHRVTFELFYFPLPDRVRKRWKGVADALGQRGGQALGALVVLGIVALGGGARVVALFAVALALGWTVLARSLRRPYVALFKEGLRHGGVPTTVPVLASDTLQTVLEAFSSTEDVVVCGAIDLLVAGGQARLLPAVLVHHPSRHVALRALEGLVEGARADAPRVARALLAHPDAQVRAAALRVRLADHVEGDEVARGLADDDPAVRAAATLGLLDLPGRTAEAHAAIAAVVEGESAPAKIALLQAMVGGPRAELVAPLLALLRSPEVPVRREALRAIERIADPVFLPHLLPQLADRRLLAETRRAIVAVAAHDVGRVEGWLDDESLPRAVRRHLPRTVSAFGTARAARALSARLEVEADEGIAYKILRGLGRLRADHPEVPIDRVLLERLAFRATERAIELLGYRLALAGRESRPEQLLVALLRGLEDRALETVFRLLGILHPELGLEDVWRGFHASDARSRDAAFEIVETLPSALRPRLVALLQGKPDQGRLRDAGGALPSWDDALTALAGDAHASLREIARHVGGGRSSVAP